MEPITVTIETDDHRDPGTMTFAVDPETWDVTLVAIDGNEDRARYSTPHDEIVQRAVDRAEAIALAQGIVCGKCLEARCECDACRCGARSFAREMQGHARRYRCRECGLVEPEPLDVACAEVSHCVGCDDDQEGVRRHQAEHVSGDIVDADWCPDCAITAAVWAVDEQHDGLVRVWSVLPTVPEMRSAA